MVATLIGHWMLNEASGTSAKDSSGNGNNGTFSGSTAPAWASTPTGGDQVTSVLFAGSTNTGKVTISNASVFQGLNSTGLTIGAWIYATGLGNSNSGRIVDYGNWFVAMHSSNTLIFQTNNFSTTDVNRISGAITLNAWHQIVVTWDGTTSGTGVNWYIDGVLSNGTSTSGSGTYGSDASVVSLDIGNGLSSGSNNRSFAGNINLVELYSGVKAGTSGFPITPTATVTTTSTPTNTPTPSVTASVTPTVTPTNTVTASVTPTITPTNTVTPSITPTSSVTPTITPTNTVTPSITPTSSVTPTITPTNTTTPSITPTSSVTATNTPTVTITPTNTATPSVTATSTPTVTPTNTVTASVTPTITPTNTVTPSVTPTSSVTPSVTPTTTPTNTVTPTNTATPSVTPTITPTNTATPSITPTITPTNTVTPSTTPQVTPTNTPTPSCTISITPTVTPTISLTPTNTATPSVTATSTPTVTITASPTITPTNTGTPQVTPTPSQTFVPASLTPTATVTLTPTAIPTITPTNTTTPTNTPTTSITPTASTTLTISVTPSVSQPTSFAAFWPFYEGSGTVLHDTSGNGNTGTLVNSPTWQTSGPTVNSNDLSFSGTTTQVTVAASSSINDLPLKSGLTVVAWIYPVNTGGGGRGRIVDKDNNSDGWFFCMFGTNQLQFGTDAYSTTDLSSVSATGAITFNTWQQVAVTWDGSLSWQNAKIYVNGVLSNGTGTNAVGTYTSDASTPLTIGNRARDSARGFNGRISEVAIYNKVLTAAQIGALPPTPTPTVTVTRTITATNTPTPTPTSTTTPTNTVTPTPTSALSPTPTATVSLSPPPPAAGQAINWNPGNYFQVGGNSHTNGVTDNQNIATIIMNLETGLSLQKGSLIKGFMGVYRWDELETSPNTFGGLATHIDPMLTWCQQNGYSYSIAINAVGFGSTGGTTPYGAPSDTFNASFGTYSSTGPYYGSVYMTSTAGPIINFTNAATMTRYAALGAAIWNRYGNSIFSYHPLWSELSFAETIFTAADCINGLAATGGFLDQIRTAMPGTYIGIPPTFIGFNTPSLYATLYASTRKNHISVGNHDSTNENTTGGWQGPRSFAGDLAFRGLQPNGTALVDAQGNVQPNMVGVEDFYTHSSEDTLGQRPSQNLLSVPLITGNNATTNAHLGDGRLGALLAHDTQQLTSHKFWAPNQTQGPDCNRIAVATGAATNYSDSSNAGVFTNLVGGIANFYSTMSRASYPSTWPTAPAPTPTPSAGVSGTCNPVAYWLMNEASGNTAFDSSGGANNATLVNSPLWETNGAQGNDIAFAGSTYLTTGPQADFADLPLTGGLSVLAWIFPTSSGGGGFGRIVDKDQNSDGWFFSVGASNGTGVSLHFGTDAFTTTDINANSVAGACPLNTWSHVAVTWDGSLSAANVRFYVNSVDVTAAGGTNASGTYTTDSFTALTIGNRGNDGIRGFAGSMNRVMVFPCALSAASIAAIGVAVTPTPTNTVTPTVTPTLTPQIAITGTAPASPVPSPSAPVTKSPTFTPTNTITPTRTPQGVSNFNNSFGFYPQFNYAGGVNATRFNNGDSGIIAGTGSGDGIKGFCIFIFWRTIDKGTIAANGPSYDWSLIESYANACDAVGKKLWVHLVDAQISSSWSVAAGNTEAPTWLNNKLGVQHTTLNYLNGGVVCKRYDPTLTGYWINFVRDFVAKYDNDSRIEALSIYEETAMNVDDSGSSVNTTDANGKYITPGADYSDQGLWQQFIRVIKAVRDPAQINCQKLNVMFGCNYTGKRAGDSPAWWELVFRTMIANKVGMTTPDTWIENWTYPNTPFTAGNRSYPSQNVKSPNNTAFYRNLTCDAVYRGWYPPNTQAAGSITANGETINYTANSGQSFIGQLLVGFGAELTDMGGYITWGQSPRPPTVADLWKVRGPGLDNTHYFTFDVCYKQSVSLNPCTDSHSFNFCNNANQWNADSTSAYPWVKANQPSTNTSSPYGSSVVVTLTPTQSVTPTISVTASVTATNTPTPTNTGTPFQTHTSTPTLTVTPTSTPGVGATVTPTSTVTVTPTVTQSLTPSRSVTFGASATPTSTVTPTNTATISITPSGSPAPGVTPTPTPSTTATPSLTPTNSPSLTASLTPSSTTTPTVTPSISATSTNTPTPSLTASVTPTNTPTPSITPTHTVTPTVTNTRPPDAAFNVIDIWASVFFDGRHQKRRPF